MVDRRTDVWAFGCVLYEMLIGERAFSGSHAADTLAIVLIKDVDWARLPSESPSSVRRLLRRCLKRDLRERLRDIGDARLDLDEGEAAPSPRAAEPAARTHRPGWRYQACRGGDHHLDGLPDAHR